MKVNNITLMVNCTEREGNPVRGGNTWFRGIARLKM